MHFLCFVAVQICDDHAVDGMMIESVQVIGTHIFSIAMHDSDTTVCEARINGGNG